MTKIIAESKLSHFPIGSPTAMLVYKIMNQNIQILNKTVPIAITLHVYVLIAGDERRQSLHTNQLVSIVNYSQQPLRIRQIRVGEITIVFGDKMESEKEQG